MLHLGNNQLTRFPPALRAAGALSTLYLSNQRSPQEPHKVGAMSSVCTVLQAGSAHALPSIPRHLH